MRQNKRYSEAFKLEVLEEFKAGKWESIHAVQKAYGLGNETFTKWLEQYGYGHLRKRIMTIRAPQEASEIKKLKEENRRLEKALAKETLLRHIDEEVLNIVCRRANTTPEEVKKKIGMI